MKRNHLILNLCLVMLLAGFVSCDKDSEPSAYEKGNLIGHYVGNCTVTMGSKHDVISGFPVEFRQNDTQSLSLNIGDEASYRSIGIFTVKKASGFKDYGSYARFNLENINVDFSAEHIPDFINNNIQLSWDIKSVLLKLYIDSQNPPKYTIASKELSFTYTGTIEITGKNTGEKHSSPIKYTFNLNRK